MASAEKGNLQIFDASGTSKDDSSAGGDSSSGGRSTVLEGSSRKYSDTASAETDKSLNKREETNMEIDDDDGQHLSGTSDDEWEFHGIDSAIIYTLYTKELLDIAVKDGAAVQQVSDKLLKIRCTGRKNLTEIEKCIEKLRAEVANVAKQEISFTPTQRQTVWRFAKEQEKSTSLVVYIDTVRSLVVIAGADYSIVQTTQHKLKVELGQVIVSTRQNRTLATDTDLSGSLVKQSNIYPDLSGFNSDDKSDSRHGYSGDRKHDGKRGGRGNYGGGSGNYEGGSGNYEGGSGNYGGSHGHSGGNSRGGSGNYGGGNGKYGGGSHGQSGGNSRGDSGNYGGGRGNTRAGYDSCESDSHAEKYKREKNVHGGFSKDEDFQFDFKLEGGFIVKVYKASITKLNVDTIVNAANDNLMHGGGVARIISEAAGYQLDKESRDYTATRGLLKVGENCKTTAGRLTRYHSVIHAVGPQWYHYQNKEDCLKDLYKTVTNVMITCDREHYRSVAMPAISAGIYGVPKELCANMYVLAAVAFSDLLSKGKYYCPKELHIIDIDLEILKLVKVSYKNWERDPSSITPEESVPIYLRKNPNKVYGGQRGYNTGGTEHGKRYGRQNSEPKPNLSAASLYSGCDIGSKQVNQASGLEEVFTINKSLSIRIYKSDIDKLNLDAVVCGIDKQLKQGGFILGALQKVGGLDFKMAFDKMVATNRSSTKIGKVYKCKGGGLRYGHVMFLVMDRLTAADQRELGTYKEGMYAVFRMAMDRQYPLVAVPLLGTGSIQKDTRKLDACCRAMLEALCEFCAKQSKHRIQEIHFVNNSDDVCGALRHVIQSAVTKGKPDFHRSVSSDESQTVTSVSAVKFEDKSSTDMDAEDHYDTIDDSKLDDESPSSLNRWSQQPLGQGQFADRHGNRGDHSDVKMENQKPEPVKTEPVKKKGNLVIFNE